MGYKAISRFGDDERPSLSESVDFQAVIDESNQL